MKTEHVKQKQLMGCLFVTVFIISMEGTIVSTAMPTIVSDLGGIQTMSWVFSMYLLTTVVSTPVFGKLIDLYGRRRVFIFGLALFVAASAACGAAHSMTQLIVCRAFQGIGAGALFPAAMTIVGSVFQERERAKLQAGFGAVGSIAGLTAPFLGGLFVDYFAWQWIFLINVPIGLVCYLLLVTSYKESVQRSSVSIDVLGGIVFIVAAGSLQLALSFESLVLLGLSVAAFLVFVQVERRSKEALIPPSLFANRIMSLCYAAAFLLSTLYIGLNVYVPFWMQGVEGTSATTAGLALAPMSVLWTAGSYLCSVLLAKKGKKTVILVGMGIILLAASALVLFSGSLQPWGLLLVASAVGLGMGLAATTFMIVVQSEARADQLGAATSTLTFLNYMAQSIGISIFGMVFHRHVLQGIAALREQGIRVDDANALLRLSSSAEGGAEVSDAVRRVMSTSISPIFLYLFVFVAVAFALMLSFPSGSRGDSSNREAKGA